MKKQQGWDKMSKEHESQLKRLREIIGVYGGEIHKLEKQNEELIVFAIDFYRVLGFMVKTEKIQ